MQSKKILIIGLVMVSAIISFSNAAAAGRYLGNFCWEVDYDGNIFPLKLGMFRLGGTHRICSGIIEIPEGPLPIFGNAERVGNDLHLALVLPNGNFYVGEWAGANSNVMHCILDRRSLDGTCRGTDVQADESDPDSSDTPPEPGYDIDFRMFNLTRVSCRSF